MWSESAWASVGPSLPWSHADDVCLVSVFLLPQNVAIRKVKVLKAPKFDLTKLMDVHGDYTEEVRLVLTREGGGRSRGKTCAQRVWQPVGVFSQGGEDHTGMNKALPHVLTDTVSDVCQDTLW